MRKLFLLVLALCLLLSLAACATKGKTSDVKPIPAAQTTVQPTPETDAPETDAPETDAPETDAPETDAPETDAPATTAVTVPETTAEPETGLTHGRIEDGAYWNESLNLRIACPDGFTFYTEDELAAQNNLTGSLLEQTDFSEVVKKNGQFIDMVMNTADGSSVNLVISPNNASLETFTDEQIISMMQGMLQEQYEKLGMHVKEAEVRTMQFMGADKPVLVLDIEVNGSSIKMYQFFDREGSDDYYATNTITLFDEDLDVQTILDGYSRIH